MTSGLYQNTGAPFRSTPSRDFIARGQRFYPSEHDLKTHAHKLRPVEGGAEPGAARVPAPEQPLLQKWAGFPGLDFASDRAYEVARDAGLGPLAFQGIKGSGENGSYRVSDVRLILGEG